MKMLHLTSIGLRASFFVALFLSTFNSQLSTALAQGSLTPPGPPAPTMKTLDQVEPRTPIDATHTPGDADSLFKITQPGSYYLTNSIAGVAGKHGIEIVKSGVTLDLNGFELLGVVGSLNGIYTTAANLTNISVFNGSIRDWGGDGVDLLGLNSHNCRLADLLASNNTGNGIRVGPGSTVSNCSAYFNMVSGIAAQTGSTITNCTAHNNSDTGIYGTASAVTNCAAYLNFTGIVGSGGPVTNCTAYLNTGNGINGNNGPVTNCTAYQNTGNGINVSNGGRVMNCTAYDNTANGISVSNACQVADCTTTLNTLDGILCTSASLIRGNTCSSNGAGGDSAGIHATGSDNRIEGNNCTTADRGIDVDATGNIIIKNTCSGNTTDWDIAANNVFGPIIDRRVPASAAVSGFTALDSTGSTHPNANFSY